MTVQKFSPAYALPAADSQNSALETPPESGAKAPVRTPAEGILKGLDLERAQVTVEEAAKIFGQRSMESLPPESIMKIGLLLEDRKDLLNFTSVSPDAFRGLRGARTNALLETLKMRIETAAVKDIPRLVNLTREIRASGTNTNGTPPSDAFEKQIVRRLQTFVSASRKLPPALRRMYLQQIEDAARELPSTVVAPLRKMIAAQALPWQRMVDDL